MSSFLLRKEGTWIVGLMSWPSKRASGRTQKSVRADAKFIPIKKLIRRGAGRGLHRPAPFHLHFDLHSTHRVYTCPTGASLWFIIGIVSNYQLTQLHSFADRRVHAASYYGVVLMHDNVTCMSLPNTG
jgi:hypothetical protein